MSKEVTKWAAKLNLHGEVVTSSAVFRETKKQLRLLGSSFSDYYTIDRLIGYRTVLPIVTNLLHDSEEDAVDWLMRVRNAESLDLARELLSSMKGAEACAEKLREIKKRQSLETGETNDD